ncbi:hypothetical protein WJX84_000661, partial [Apatococcus fuscideae]
MICETGPIFHGSFYVLPQHHAALDLKQGIIIWEIITGEQPLHTLQRAIRSV